LRLSGGKILGATGTSLRIHHQLGRRQLIFCTNLGAVSPAIKDGLAGSGKEMTVAPTTVTIGNAPAPVGFSGLASGFVGLYQVNAQVPTGLTAKNQPVGVTVGGASSKPVMLPVT
jgi:uncharacterized protein (TIGR03437 family)